MKIMTDTFSELLLFNKKSVPDSEINYKSIKEPSEENIHTEKMKVQKN